MITIEVADCENINIDLSEETNKLAFNAMANGQKYSLDLEFFEPIVKEESKWNTKGRYIIINLSKKDKDQTEEWWSRLVKEKGKNQFITIDWARWADPDDEPEEQKKGQGRRSRGEEVQRWGSWRNPVLNGQEGGEKRDVYSFKPVSPS